MPREGRAPRGARGLKFATAVAALEAIPSRPSRGAWIEIHLLPPLLLLTESRPSRGAWIEIRMYHRGDSLKARRAPRGARGLKCLSGESANTDSLSRPSRGAWIEITLNIYDGYELIVAPLAGRVD